MAAREQDMRRDRENMYPEVVTFFCVAGFLRLVQDRPIEGISVLVQYVVNTTLFVSMSICLVGILLGSRYFFPNAQAKSSYILQVCGLVPLLLILTYFNWIVSWTTDSFYNWTFIGIPSVILQIGVVRSVVDFIVGIRRDKEEVEELENG